MSFLDDYSVEQREQFTALLNPIADRADEIGLEAAISEHWDAHMTPAAHASMHKIVPHMTGETLESAQQNIPSADLGAAKVLAVIIAQAQGWTGERIL